MVEQREIKVSNPQQAILSSTTDRVLFLSAQGSGKSFLAGLISADFAINYPHVRGLIGANTYQQLSKSTLDRVFKVWLDFFGWINGKHYVCDKIPPPSFVKIGAKLKSYEGTISFNNGASIFTNSLDNYLSIDGTEACWSIIDETKDTKEEAVKEVITGRLRQPGLWVKDGVVYAHEVEGARGYNPLYVLTSPAKVQWLNEWFGLGEYYELISQKIFSKTDFFQMEKNNQTVVISSVYHNEENLSKGFIEQRIKDLAGSPNLIDMLIYGSPIAKAGGEYFAQFNRLEHVGKVEFDPKQNVHISLDFNVVPYISMLCFQIYRGDDGIYQVNCFDEFALTSPKNNTEALAKEFRNKYCEIYKPFPGLFYYGDASGKNMSTLSSTHNFEHMEKVLKPWLNQGSNRVLNRNPSLVATRDFVNKIFVNGLPIRLKISDRCKNLLLDLEFMKEDPEGGPLKVMAKNKLTGQSYEKYKHVSDCLRYFLISAFANLFEKK